MSATVMKEGRRQVRRVLGEDAWRVLQQQQTQQQAVGVALQAFAERIDGLSKRVEAGEAFQKRGLWARLTWLVRGR
jgi:hypothetical protein